MFDSRSLWGSLCYGPEALLFHLPGSASQRGNALCVHTWLIICVRSACVSQAETEQTGLGVWKRGSEAWRPALVRSSHHSSLTCPVYSLCVNLELILCVCVCVSMFKYTVDVWVAACRGAGFNTLRCLCTLLGFFSLHTTSLCTRRHPSVVFTRRDASSVELPNICM